MSSPIITALQLRGTQPIIHHFRTVSETRAAGTNFFNPGFYLQPNRMVLITTVNVWIAEASAADNMLFASFILGSFRFGSTGMGVAAPAGILGVMSLGWQGEILYEGDSTQALVSAYVNMAAATAAPETCYLDVEFWDIGPAGSITNLVQTNG